MNLIYFERIYKINHIICNTAAVPGQILTDAPAVPPEIRDNTAVLPLKWLYLGSKCEDSSAKMAVKKQYCFTTSQFFVIKLQIF